MLQIGYLTVTKIISHNKLEVRIPNKEIYEYFAKKFSNLLSHNNEV